MPGRNAAPVAFEFEPDVGRATIRLMIKGKPTSGISTYAQDADQTDAGLMDETAKYVFEKPGRFGELGADAARNNASAGLRRRLEREKEKGPGAEISPGDKRLSKKA